MTIPAQIIKEMKQMDNDQIAEVLYGLAKHFLNNAKELTNMNAKEIANSLRQAASEIESRTSN